MLSSKVGTASSQLVSSNWPQSGLIHFPRSAPVSLQRGRLGLEWTGVQHAVQVGHQHLCEGGVCEGGVWGSCVREECVKVGKGSEVCVGGVWVWRWVKRVMISQTNLIHQMFVFLSLFSPPAIYLHLWAPERGLYHRALPCHCTLH